MSSYHLPDGIVQYDSFPRWSVRSQGKALVRVQDCQPHADLMHAEVGTVLQIAASLGHIYGIAFRYLPPLASL
jgi:hypothetical protein